MPVRSRKRSRSRTRTRSRTRPKSSRSKRRQTRKRALSRTQKRRGLFGGGTLINYVALCRALDKITHYTWRFGSDLDVGQKTKVIDMYNSIADKKNEKNKKNKKNKKNNVSKLDPKSFDRRVDKLKSAVEAVQEGEERTIPGLRGKLEEKFLLTKQVIVELNMELYGDPVVPEVDPDTISQSMEILGSYYPRYTKFIAEESDLNQVADVDQILEYLADKEDFLKDMEKDMDDKSSFFDDESLELLPDVDADAGAVPMDVE